MHQFLTIKTKVFFQMSQKRIFKVINDGEIVIQLYNPLTDLAGVLKVLREGYMKDSNTFVAFEMNTPEAANARREYEDLIHAVLRDGISIIAQHSPSMQIIGYCLNKIHTRPKAGQGNFYEEFRDNIQSEIVKKLLNFRIMKDKQMDVYEMYKTEYIFEPVYAAILPEYRMQDIAYHIIQCTVLLAREISRGIYPDTMAEEIKGKKTQNSIW
uniref:Uncharacterized protein n=1 Tax=Nyssomyia neivai TaxID=330878 RepID=A0A1L8D8G2_9DIPT